MKLISTRFVSLLIASIISFAATAQKSFFTDAAESAVQKSDQKRVIIPEKYRTLQLDTAGMVLFLRSLPSEQNITDRNTTPVLMIPMPDGSTARFHMWESSAMAPELAAAYPEIKTFTGQGIDDRTATIKLDWTMFGFHAMILSPVTGSIFIDPYDQKTVTNYISYYKKDYKKKETFQEFPPIENIKKNANAGQRPADILAGFCVGTQLRTYRLALACTGEYAVAVAGPSPTKAATLAKMVISVNRVNGVYEKEVAIRMVLIANNTKIIFTNPATDPFTANNNGTNLINQSQTVITDSIGSANYDIGHTFSTGAGGQAQLGCVCNDGVKARGITGLSNPVGDAYDIDYVAHEMGHQFGGNHSFNSVMGSCGGGNVSTTTNAEPGSGTTIMAYAGICGSDDLAAHSDAQFHAVSFDEITQFSIASSGNSCATTSNTGNNPPVVNAGADYTIPDSTFFVLTGNATDANGDPLFYSWEQVDVGGLSGPWNAPSGNAPLFRSFSPVATPVRYFPRLNDQVKNVRTIGEIMPTYARTMHFRLTARDNRAAGGGVCYDEASVAVNKSGPFSVTYPTAAGVVWSVNDFQTITWNPAATTTAPISCANVSIQLSTDSGYTFPVTLIASTPNDGSEEIQVPNNISNKVRIRIMAVGNIFYDISNNNLTIQNSPTSTFALNNPAPVLVCAASSGTATLKSGSLAGFNTAIALSASLNPAGTTVSFGTSSLPPGNNTTVTLNNTNTLAAGVYTVRVTGIAGAITKTKDIQFIVGSAVAPAILSLPNDNATAQSTLPSFNWSTVAGASSYTLEISTVSDFSSIVQTVPNISTLPYVLTAPLLENTEYYWRVKTVNTCGTGSPSAIPNRFKTWLNTCKTSFDVPKSISGSGTPTVISTITIPASAGVIITDLNIKGLSGVHQYVGDLTFTLKAPDNTSVVFLNSVCNDQRYANFNLNFDDASVNPVPCPPTDGSVVAPANPLSVFNGINSTGTWTLTVKDNSNNDGGTLEGWGLNINSTSATGCVITSTPLAITYTFTGNGNWNVASNWSGNSIPPTPLPAGSSIVINPAAGGQCVLNVAQTISSGASLTVTTGKNLVIPGTLTIQ